MKLVGLSMRVESRLSKPSAERVPFPAEETVLPGWSATQFDTLDWPDEIETYRAAEGAGATLLIVTLRTPSSSDSPSREKSPARRCAVATHARIPSSVHLENLRGDTRLFGPDWQLEEGTQNLLQKRKLFSKLAEKGVKSLRSKAGSGRTDHAPSFSFCGHRVV